jgi:formate hydrogenlyase subunit 3/multisubunit Na+/H+ antiporter MnhD subunit
MNELLILAAVATPLLLIPLVFAEGRQWLPVVAALPGLLAALLVPTGTVVSLPWLLLGVHLHFDEVAGLLLPASAFAWLVAALWSRLRSPDSLDSAAYRAFFLAAMGGNLLVILAADIISFYVGFALMGLAAYPLMLRRSQQARFAARVYLAFTLVGELALFSGMVGLYVNSGSLLFSEILQHPVSGTGVALLLIGFGIKVALPALHLWLPMVYSFAPIVTAAVLSGPMMKAGLVGWLRFLPIGQEGLAAWGQILFVLGVIGVLMGVVFGCLQRRPQAVLGYSSIAKMGLISAMTGLALAEPARAEPIVAAILVFAIHHLLVKSALFLGIGEWHRLGSTRPVMIILGVLALSLAAAPFTGGAAAKLTLKDTVGVDLAWLLTLSALGTALLMIRFLLLVHARGALRRAVNDGLGLWWLLLPVAALGPFLPWQLPWQLTGTGPLLAAALMALGAWWVGRRYPALCWQVPPGDMLRWIGRLRARPRPTAASARSAWQPWALWHELASATSATVNLLVPGLLLLLLAVGLLVTLLVPA